RPALAGLSPRRAARRPPGGAERRAHSARGRRDRRLHRRDDHADVRAVSGARPGDHHRRQLPDVSRVRGDRRAVRIRDRVLLWPVPRRAQARTLDDPTTRRAVLTKPGPTRSATLLLAAAAIACALALTACGTKQDAISARG